MCLVGPFLFAMQTKCEMQSLRRVANKIRNKRNIQNNYKIWGDFMETEVHKNKFGTRLKNVRDARKITFETAAISANIDKCRLLDIELDHAVPDDEEVLSLCKLYRIGVDRIIKEG